MLSDSWDTPGLPPVASRGAGEGHGEGQAGEMTKARTLAGARAICAQSRVHTGVHLLEPSKYNPTFYSHHTPGRTADTIITKEMPSSLSGVIPDELDFLLYAPLYSHSLEEPMIDKM